MTIASLEVSSFRCIENAKLDFDSRCTVIAGANAAGKTSFLEAIHVLSCGRSFRTSQTASLFRNNEPSFRILGQVSEGGRSQALGLEWQQSLKEIHIGGAKTRGFASLTAAMPVQVIDPGAHKLLEEGPSGRRRFIDWGVFHVEPQFIGAWRYYHRALSQRNSALRAQQPLKVVCSWDEELASSGERVADLREQYVSGFEPIFREVSSELLGVNVGLVLRRGWAADTKLLVSLESNRNRDIRYRTSTVGPHRAELEIQVDGVLAKDRISRGQQKLLACALTLAQLRYRVELGQPPACLLLDDPAAELDVDNLGKLLMLVTKTPVQVIVTAVDPSTVDLIAPGKRFHVEQGRIRAVL